MFSQNFMNFSTNLSKIEQRKKENKLLIGPKHIGKKKLLIRNLRLVKLYLMNSLNVTQFLSRLLIKLKETNGL